MTVGDWISARAADAPAHLVAGVRDALGPAGWAAGVDETPERCVAAADALVQTLLARAQTGRDSALALLAADALVTYAFEAAADDPDRLPARAEDAARRLATLR